MTPSMSMPPPGMKDPAADPAMPEDPMEDGQKDESGKATDAEAIVLRADEKTCGSCLNYDSAQGNCQKVVGDFDPDDRCLRFYEAGGSGEDERPADGSMPPPGMA